MTIRNVKDADYTAFAKLFCDYYAELDCEDDSLPLFEEFVAPDLKAGLLSVAVAENGDNLCGFVIFQIDDVINDWCYAEGKGDIREIYVAPEHRRNGFGASLLRFAESALKADGAEEVYLLPTDESEKFFIACGYCDIGEYCAELDCKVFGKNF